MHTSSANSTLDELKYGPFSLAEARKICGDLFEANPRIFWTDFLLSLTVGTTCYSLVQRLPQLLQSPYALGIHIIWLQVAAFFVACALYYRCALFIHEMVHLRTGEFSAFRIFWNLLCGIPFLMPTFVYYTHLDHHRRKHYGTRHDGEYLPLVHQSPWAILFYLSQTLIIPVLAILRWLVFAPLAWVMPSFRRWVQQHASSMVMDPSYVRPLPTKEVMRVWRMQELACFLFTLGAAVLFISGRLPIALLLQAYATAVVIIFVNSIRTLGAHRFVGDGRELTFVEQLVDSVNYTHWPLITGLWAPVGLRFHALHHLFPAMPYHNLAKAHRRLMAQLPADSPYRLTESRSLIGTLRQLWRLSAANRSKPRAPQPPATPANSRPQTTSA